MVISTVFFVELNSRGPFETDEPGREMSAGGSSYLLNVYLSLERAKAAVELWAQRGELGQVRWTNGQTAVWTAYVVGGSTEWLCKVVALGVVGDDQPEPGA